MRAKWGRVRASKAELQAAAARAYCSRPLLKFFDFEGDGHRQRAKTSGEKDGIFAYEMRLLPV